VLTHKVQCGCAQTKKQYSTYRCGEFQLQKLKLKSVFDIPLRMTSTSAVGTKNCSRHTADCDGTTRKGPLDPDRVGPNNSANT